MHWPTPPWELPSDARPAPSWSLQHLLLRLKPVNRALRAAAAMQADANARLTQAGPGARCITEQHVRHLLGELDRLVEGDPRLPCGFALTAAEAAAEERLRRAARDAGSALPLDALASELELSDFEVHAVLICAAAQLHPAYGRLFAYVHDDMHRRAPSLQLLASLGASGTAEQAARREALEPHGRLCRLGVLRTPAAADDSLQREYVLDDAALRALLRPDVSWRRLFFDPDEVSTAAALPLHLFPDGVTLLRIAQLLRSGEVSVVGLWGPRHCGGRDAAVALAAELERPLRRIALAADDVPGVRRALRIAAALDAVAWIETDGLAEEARRTPGLEERLGDLIASAAKPVLLTGRVPWHPPGLLAHRCLVEVPLRAPTLGERAALWQAAVKEAEPGTCMRLAHRYQLGPSEMQAAAHVARLDARLRGGSPRPPEEALSVACRAVSLRGGTEYARLVVPRRRPEDLVLPADLHRRVLEIAAFYRAWARVDESWGFGRLLTGGGIKVLITGDSGTGKSAAAEVIAGQVDAAQTLLKVNIATVVSKWVGETEKALEAVFQHAEESHSILFFDEADVLFAKRGEVEKGADRYSNLEVGFLLQRLEDYAGLAILATNHKDSIDEAFMRRFQAVLHFPRPGIAERRRLWQLSFPPQAPLADDIDIDLLQNLDLTGAGIVGAARTAALLAAQTPGERIAMRHVVRGVVRQFQHEARLLPVAQLGRFAHLAEGGE